ncbi:cadherin-like beta sandwich domain-containing protein [Erysipelothrix anatis]|uniref:cadherin-like beta sandwich domain-containing protein n=1 Tax=Erysipelothrix anatis TaxID=2683713 RepID=UPI001358BAF3|nr:cadherin-like beta sandwich domain-containing protein [Erysipelothrix anatis]
MKKVFKLIMVLLLFGTMFAENYTVSAATPNKVSLRTYDEQTYPYENIQDSKPLPAGSTVKPGDVFRFDVNIETNGDNNIAMFQYEIVYDDKLVEPIVIDNQEVIYPLDIEGGAFTTIRQGRNEILGWVVNHNIIDSTVQYTGQTVQYPDRALKASGSMMTMYFKVKADAEAGKEINFKLNDLILANNFSNQSVVPRTLDPTLKLTVAGEAPDLGATLQSVNIYADGSDVDGHDYMETSFKVENDSFDLVVPSQVSKIRGDITLKEGAPSGISMVLGKQGNINDRSLELGNNKFEVVIKHNGNTLKSYGVNILRLSDDVSIKSTTAMTDDGSVLTFDNTNSTNVKQSTKTVMLNTVLNDPNGSISYLSEIPVEGNILTLNPSNVQKTQLSMNVMAQSSQPQYAKVFGNKGSQKKHEYTFNRNSSDVTLSKLIVGNQPIVLEEGVRDYTITVDNAVSEVLIEATTNFDAARVYSDTLKNTSENLNTFSGLLELIPGSNKTTLEVRAQDGTPAKYTITVIRDRKKNNDLHSLNALIKNMEMITAFDANTTYYDLGSVPYSKNETITITASVNPDNASQIVNQSMLGTHALVTGLNSFEIQVVAENESIKTYTIQVTMEANTATEITDETGGTDNPFTPKPDSGIETIKPDSMGPDNKPLDPDGQGDGIAKDKIISDNTAIYRYTVHVPNAVTTFGLDNMDFTIPENARIEGGDAIDLSTGLNTFTFKIVSNVEGSLQSQYIFSVIRAKSSEAALKTLSSNVGTLTPEFSEHTNAYTLNVGADINAVIFDATAKANGVILETIPHTVNVEKEATQATITVSSEDGTSQQVYTIIINRAKSDANDLTALQIDGKDILKSIKDNVYTQTVDTSQESLNIFAEKQHDGAILLINGEVVNQKDVVLDYGVNTILVDVVSESGKKQTYTLTITRTLDHNANLKSLTINNEDFKGLDKDVLSYTLEDVENGVTHLNVAALAENANATVQIDGTSNLKVGKNYITVTVTAHDGKTTKVYTLEVSRKVMDIGVDGFVPGDKVERIENDDSITNPIPGNYYYVVHVPINMKEFSKKDISLAPIAIESGYVISNYHNDPLKLSRTQDNIYTFDVSTQSGELAGTYHIRVVYPDVMPPQIESLKINGKTVPAYAGETAFTINLDDYLAHQDTSITFEIVPDVATNIAEPLEYTFTMKGIATKQLPITLTDSVTTLVNTYQFTFTRSLSKDVSLESLTIDGYKSNGETLPLKLNHSIHDEPYDLFEVLDVPADVDTITIHATPTNANAQVQQGLGEFELKPGKNVFSIQVQAEDQSVPVQQYQIVVIRKLGLLDLKVGSHVIDLSKPSTDWDGSQVYRISEPFDAIDFTHELKATPNHASVTLSGNINRTYELEPGTHRISFEAKAQDGITKQQYHIEYTRTPSIDARLKTLNLNDAKNKIEPAFNPDIYEYIIDIPSSKDFWDLSDFKVEAMHPKTRVKPNGIVKIEGYDEVLYEIQTESETKATLTYTFKIRKESYNFLSDLHIGQNQGLIEPEFNPEVMTYQASIFPGVETFRVYYTLDERFGATVENASELESIPVSSLPRTVDIKVKAKNGDRRTYQIDVDRGLSSRLASLTSDSADILPPFEPGTLEYDVYVPQTTHTISLNPTTEDPKATLSGTYKDVALLDGITPIKITVTNGNYKTDYIVRVHKVKDKTALDTVEVVYGSQRWKALWNEQTQQYEYTVPASIDLEAIMIAAKPQDQEATYEVSNPVDDGAIKRFIIKVTDSFNITKTYNVAVDKSLSENANLKLLQVDGIDVVGFNKETLSYAYTINRDTANVTAIPEDNNARVEITYPKSFADKDVITITVTASQGNQQTYTITLARDADNTALLDSLSVQEGVISPKFNPLQTDYYLTIPNEINQVTPLYTNPVNSHVSVENQSNIEVGNNHVVNVIVTAQNGDKNTYRIHVNRQAPSQNYLESLLVSGNNHGTYNLSPQFSKFGNTYLIDVQDGDSEFTFEATATNNATITGLGTIPVVSFPYSHEIRVVGKDNLPRIYTIMFHKKASSNTAISNLWTDVGKLDPVFDINKTAYNLDVDESVETIEVFGTKTDEKQVIKNLGKHSLKPGRNTIEVEVVAEDGTKVTYTLFVNRAQSSNFGLDTLTVNEGTLSPSFSTGVRQYYVDVDGSVDTLEINATSAFEGASVEGTGTKTLKLGVNIFEIHVTRERNENATYFVVVNRGNTSSNHLSYLQLEGHTMDQPFDKMTQNYTTSIINNEPLTLPVVAISEDPMAKVSISGNENLPAGDHTISITVHREDMEDRIYTIAVTILEMKLKSDIHTVEPKHIQTIHDNQSVLDVKQQMTNPQEHLVFYRNGAKLEDTDLVGSGVIIKLVVDNQEYDEKTIIVKGDVNGDGRIGVADIISVRSYVLGGTLTDWQLLAADVNNDQKVGVADLIGIRSHILGSKNIFEKNEDEQ